MDWISYALVTTVYIVASIVHGSIIFNHGPLFFPDYISLFFFFLAANLALIAVLYFVEIYLRKALPARKLAVFARLLASALIILGYTYLFFQTSGGWVAGARPGILGGLGNVGIDLLFYILFVFLVHVFLALKARVDKRVNTSIIVFIVAVVISLPELYFIFLAVK